MLLFDGDSLIYEKAGNDKKPIYHAIEDELNNWKF